MGVIRCERHGLQGVFLACDHVTRAVLADDATPPEYRLHRITFADVAPEDVSFPNWLCDACAELLGWTDADRTPEGSTRICKRVSSFVNASCIRCATERVLERFPPSAPASDRTTW